MKRSETDRVFALLTAAGGKVEATINAYDATWEIYDSLPGHEHSHTDTYWKTGKVRNFEWTCFRPHGDREEETDELASRKAPK